MKEKKEISNYEKVKLWWKFEGQYLWHDFKHGINNLIKWFPIIWKDRNYDYAYIYDILKTKLEFQSKYIGERNIHTRAKLDAKHMKYCAALIEKVKSEYYIMEPYDYQKNEFVFKPLNDGSDCSELLINEKSENLDDYFKRYSRIHKIVMKDSDELSKREIARKIAHINQERAKKLMFKILEERIEAWWD